MCRLLFVHSKKPFRPEKFRAPFAEMARTSSEFQGHGWGCAYLHNGSWKVYRNILPVWEDRVEHLPAVRTALFHARSAFRNQKIAVQYNMPFLHGSYAFIFNGELHGVRIQKNGRIGAEKLFHFILNGLETTSPASFPRIIDMVIHRTRYVKALNLIMADFERLFLATHFNVKPDYFTLYEKRDAEFILVSSRPLWDESSWKPIANHTCEVRNYDNH